MYHLGPALFCLNANLRTAQDLSRAPYRPMLGKQPKSIRRVSWQQQVQQRSRSINKGASRRAEPDPGGLVNNEWRKVLHTANAHHFKIFMSQVHFTTKTVIISVAVFFFPAPAVDVERTDSFSIRRPFNRNLIS